MNPMYCRADESTGVGPAQVPAARRSPASGDAAAEPASAGPPGASAGKPGPEHSPRSGPGTPDRECGPVPAGRSSLPDSVCMEPAESGTTNPAGGVVDADAALSVGSKPRTWTLALPAGMELLSLNDRSHWAQRHRKTQALKQAAWALAKQAEIPPLERASFVVEYQPPDRRHRDAENTCAISGKACVDGVVAAGVLVDDECPRYVTGIYCTIGELYPRGRLVLHVIEVVS